MASKSILITGAARGLGLALVEESVRSGFRVFALVRKSEDAMTLTDRFGDGCVPILADLCEPSSEQRIGDVLVEAKAKLDMLVNNAGIPGSGSELEAVELDQVTQLFQIHCIAALRCTRAALPFLLSTPRPVIFNISSRLGSISKVVSGAFDDEKHSYAYRIAKAAQNMATACLRAELGGRGVTVMALHPGKLRTALSSHPDGQEPAEAARKLLVLAQQIESKTDSAYVDIEGKTLEW